MNGAGFYFSGDPYRAVLQGVHAALAAPDACIKILAERGFGKSTLCVKLAQFLNSKWMPQKMLRRISCKTLFRRLPMKLLRTWRFLPHRPPLYD